MTTPQLRLCREADIRAVLNRDGSTIDTELTIRQMHSGPSFTAEVDGMVIGCAGVVIPWPGIGMCWMMLAKEAAHYALWLTRTTRRILADLCRAFGLHRLEAIALKDSDRNQRWFRALGFHAEQHGTAQAYFSDKRSIVRFERIVEG